MVDQRLFHKDIFQSSLYYQLGEDFPGRELHAQRLFETLILLADDYGRGRFMPCDLRTRGFSSARVAYAEVSLEDIETWMVTISANGAAYCYEIGNERYYFLPKWFEYQTLKYRKKSHLPNPPDDLLSELGLFLSDSGEILPMEEKKDALEDKNTPNRDNLKDVKKGKVKKSNSDTPKEVSGYPQEYYDFINELFPKQFKDASLEKQVIALDFIIRLDRDKVNPEIKPERWQTVLFKLLRAARKDEGEGTFPGYQRVFQSVSGLRKDNSIKLKNMYNVLKGKAERDKPKTRTVTKYKCDRCGHIYDYLIDACSTMTCLEYDTHSFTPIKIEVEV